MAEEFLFEIFGTLLIALAILFVSLSIRVVPQQQGWIVERLGKFHCVLEPGLNFIIPLIDRVAYKHSLKEIPMDTEAQVCITKDNTQLSVDGLLYFQVTDPKLASYGTSNFVQAISQLAQTSLRSVIGQMELDKTFEEREEINRQVVHAIDEAAHNWGVKVLRYEIKDLTPPAEILRAMQQQITAEREKRALIAASEGKKQEAINLAEGQRAALIAQSEGEKQSAINRAEGEARSIEAVAAAQAEAIRLVAAAVAAEGGMSAVNLQVAEKYVEAFSNVAKQGNTLIVPADMGDMASLVSSALSIVKAGK
ncbi:SPFH domain-containing protein [Mailhella massiliensis]|uniref:SPFH/Band 7/PHB domain protein n=1 Tax=Mailhella massiliensis TaxID=1903261 RepID=A0A921AUK3_9BACT|nr:SPFH domain-containing protein [Mailhella massiliensis]HJD96119.1 SPFH/Band 7/PHB domain protein [Mailhella massiliensis]